MNHVASPMPLARDCEAIQIPAGTKVILRAGTPVTLMQSLGGNHTVVMGHGEMVLINGKDGDAIGLEAEATPESRPVPANPEEMEKLVWKELRTVFDPEIPVNVVDLGLVYSCRVLTLPSGKYAVDIVMTLTAPGCGMGNVLKADAEAKIFSVPGVEQANAEVVVDPPWNQGMMTDAARLQLGLM